MSRTTYEPWTPAAEHRRRWERLGLLRDLVEGAAWGWPIDNSDELARRENRVTAVVAAMAEIAPAGYFVGDELAEERRELDDACREAGGVRSCAAGPSHEPAHPEGTEDGLSDCLGCGNEVWVGIGRD